MERLVRHAIFLSKFFKQEELPCMAKRALNRRLVPMTPHSGWWSPPIDWNLIKSSFKESFIACGNNFQRVGPMPRIREIHCTETCRNHVVTRNRPLHNPWMVLVVCNYSVIYLPTILPTPTNRKHQVLWAYVRKLVMTHRIWIQSNPSYLYFSLAQQRGFEPDVVII